MEDDLGAFLTDVVERMRGHSIKPNQRKICFRLLKFIYKSTYMK